MGDSTSIWGAVIAGLASAYGAKKQKDAQKDAYKYKENELDRQREYAQQMYQARQNAPQAKMARYMMEYYMPQFVDRMKKNNKGGDTTVLDRMLADIMGGMRSNGQSSASGGYGGSDPFLALPGVRRV